nr:tryptophan 2,3-dioxygenase family protein [Oculatella sp. LEGE 06141]
MPPLDPNLDVTQNHYWSYHDLEALLQCKRPLTASQDEDLFIAVHQICELAFNQMIIDLDRVLEAIETALQAPSNAIIGDTSEACYFFQRVLKLYEVAVGTMPILGTMRAFAEFRTSIGPTSGFQSFQFRRLEIMSGVHKYWEGGTNNAQGTPHVAETAFDRQYGANLAHWFDQYQQHNLAHYYQALLDRAPGKPLAEKLLELQQHPYAKAVLNDLKTYDELQTRFHRHHLGLAVQQLKLVGVDVGTGGTSFRDYLAKYEKELTPLFPGLSAASLT